MTKMKDCLCGGRPVFVDTYMVDSLRCNKCDYKTEDYFDGMEYAILEWEKRNDRDEEKQ